MKRFFRKAVTGMLAAAMCMSMNVSMTTTETYAAEYSQNETVVSNIEDNDDLTDITAETQKTNVTPVAAHGRLSVKGAKLVDEYGDQFQICGISTHGINWDVGAPFCNKSAFKTLRNGWGVNCVRIAMYTAEYNGYCSGGNKTELKKQVCKAVDDATSLGMYVIIDWHILNDNNPNTNASAAKEFFDYMSKKYAKNKNVLYEICNEPNGGTSWEDIKSYAKKIIPVIRKNDKKGIIIVGTPNWSQDVDAAANSPITGYSNLMYTLHFYANTHTDWLRDKLKNAVSKGLPVFVTEFGTCDASGNGGFNSYQTKEWLNLLSKYKIGYCAWSLSNKNETASLLKSGTSKKSGWSSNDLSESGKLIKSIYKKKSDKPSKVKKVKLKSAKKISGGVKLSFTKSKGATGYVIYRKTGNGKWSRIATVRGGSKTSYLDTKAQSGKKYSYVVKAYKGSNKSLPSNKK